MPPGKSRTTVKMRRAIALGCAQLGWEASAVKDYLDWSHLPLGILHAIAIDGDTVVAIQAGKPTVKWRMKRLWANPETRQPLQRWLAAGCRFEYWRMDDDHNTMRYLFEPENYKKVVKRLDRLTTNDYTGFSLRIPEIELGPEIVQSLAVI